MSRMDKVNQQIKREIGQMIQMGEVSDPRLAMVTITYVETSKDLRHARVSFSVLSDKDADIQNAADGLKSARKRMRKILGQRIKMRFTPELNFVYDQTIAQSIKLDQTFQEIMESPKDETSN